MDKTETARGKEKEWRMRRPKGERVGLNEKAPKRKGSF